MDYERMCMKIATRDLYIKYDVEIFEEYLKETEKERERENLVLHKAQIFIFNSRWKISFFFMISDCVKVNKREKKNSCIYSTYTLG